MKLKFKTPEEENKFKEFVCENKNILETLFLFGSLAKSAIVRIAFKALSDILKVTCPEKKTT